MTIRIYEEDAYCHRFNARVMQCEPFDGGYAVVLDRTAFFPEGGGQAADCGVLGTVAVRDVQIAGEEILHYIDAPLPVGDVVACEIDWRTRFSRMQKHTGEHIVSGIVHKLYGFDNVGFHLGSEDVTLDFNGEMTRQQLDHIEDLANEVVWDNVPVYARFPSDEELPTLVYRSKKELTGPVRIVTVEGCDVCACCAPHVSRTGEIGVIKLLDAIRYKGGVRVHMQCGRDALADYRQCYAATATVAASLSVKHRDTVSAVERLLAQKEALSQELRQFKRRLALTAVASVAATDAPVCVVVEPMDMEAIREAVLSLVPRCTGVCAVFAGTDTDGYQFAACGGDLHSLSAEMKEHLGARGGGSEQIIQGRVQAPAKAIRAFFEAL